MMCFLILAEIHWWEVVVDFVTIVLVREISDMYFVLLQTLLKLDVLGWKTVGAIMGYNGNDFIFRHHKYWSRPDSCSLLLFSLHDYVQYRASVRCSHSRFSWVFSR